MFARNDGHSFWMIERGISGRFSIVSSDGLEGLSIVGLIGVAFSGIFFSGVFSMATGGMVVDFGGISDFGGLDGDM